jgi:serine/threonine protein kinase
LKKGNSGMVGGIFDREGDMREKELEEVVSLEKRFEGRDAGERAKFVAFIKMMLVLDPEERPSAKELLEEARLKHDYDEDVSEGQ